jgi:hypothetical protein
MTNEEIEEILRINNSLLQLLAGATGMLINGYTNEDLDKFMKYTEKVIYKMNMFRLLKEDSYEYRRTMHIT